VRLCLKRKRKKQKNKQTETTDKLAGVPQLASVQSQEEWTGKSQ
jgi:hypothetical protein